LILNRARSTGTVRTTRLAEEFGVTEETIRRDLEKLSGHGELLRTHGGAMLTDLSRDLSLVDRKDRQTAEKESIARAALGLLDEGDTILLDSSSTALTMAAFLPEALRLTVVTNSLPIIQSLARRRDLAVIQLGGSFDPRGLRFSGLLTEEALRSIHIDRFFFSARGFDPLNGASDADPEQARLKRLMVKHVTWRCALVDHTKIGCRSRLFFASPEEIDVLVTDNSGAARLGPEFASAPYRICHGRDLPGRRNART
jgi:DeoR/GlpR family transcriptional regulator of sugar metabolism